MPGMDPISFSNARRRRPHSIPGQYNSGPTPRQRSIEGSPYNIPLILQSPLRFEPHRQTPPPPVHPSHPSHPSHHSPSPFVPYHEEHQEHQEQAEHDDRGGRQDQFVFSPQDNTHQNAVMQDNVDHTFAGQPAIDFDNEDNRHNIKKHEKNEEQSYTPPQYEFKYDIPKDSFQQNVVLGEFGAFAKLPKSFESLIKSDSSFLDSLAALPASQLANNESYPQSDFPHQEGQFVHDDGDGSGNTNVNEEGGSFDQPNTQGYDTPPRVESYESNHDLRSAYSHPEHDSGIYLNRRRNNYPRGKQSDGQTSARLFNQPVSFYKK